MIYLYVNKIMISECYYIVFNSYYQAKIIENFLAIINLFMFYSYIEYELF